MVSEWRNCASLLAGHLAQDLCLGAIHETTQLRPKGRWGANHKPAAELRLVDGRWVARLVCSWGKSQSQFHLRVGNNSKIQPIIAALRGARPTDAPADFCISLAADPAQVKEAAAAIADLARPPPVIVLGLGQEELNGDEVRDCCVLAAHVPMHTCALRAPTLGL